VTDTDGVRRTLVTSLLLLFAWAAPASAATPLLPDLYEETPYSLGIEAVNSPEGTRYHLGFGSTVYNFGRGPLRIEGSRSGTEVPQMDAAQVIKNDRGENTRVPNVGKLEYVDSITHRHWHYLRFNTYALRTLDGKLAVPDQKTGFCLGDRVLAHDFETLPGQPREPLFTDGCGYDAPELLTVSEGISVNYGDPYNAHVEGQFVDITGIAAGRYELVHHVNADRSLRESDYTNNQASVLLDVSWPGGHGAPPKVVQLMRCDLSGKCPVAPELTRRKAVSYARQAFKRAYRASSARVACGAPRGGKARCTGTWRGGSGSVTVRNVVSGGRIYWTYSATARGEKAARGRVVVPFGRGTVIHYTPAAKAKPAYCPLSARGSAAWR
jgi:hypothetical protein